MGKQKEVARVHALCSCGRVNVTAPFTTGGFDSTVGPHNGGPGGSVASNGGGR